MLLSRFPVLVAGLLVAAATGWSQPRSNVFVLSQPQQGGNISVFNSNPFTQVASPTSINDAGYLFLNPAGTRVYVVGLGGGVSVLDVNADFAQIQLYSLGQQVRDAAITPDGRKLLVLTTSLRVIDLAFDLPPSIPSIEAGSLPESVAVSFDSKRAYVTSGISRTLVAIDLDTNQRIAQQGIAGTPGGVGVSPNGLIYVPTSNVLYEIDWRDGFVVTVPGGFPFLGEPARPSFTPDGRYVLFPTRPNNSASSVIQFEVATRTMTSVTGPVNLAGTVVVSNQRAFAHADGIVYAINIGSLTPPGQAPIGALPGTLALAASDEKPTARYLFGMTTNNLYRVDLIGGLFAGPSTTVSPAGQALFRATPSANPTAGLQRTMSGATVRVGSPSFPIAVRAVDASGRPVANVPIQYTTSGQVQLPVTNATTNNEGLAAVSATVPNVAGSYSVRATSSGGFVDIPIDVTTSPVVEERFSMVSGQGQVVTAGSTFVPFQVRVRNEIGEPVTGAVVNWSVASGIGVTVLSPASTTDTFGIATGLISTTSFTPSEVEQFRVFTVEAAISTGTLGANLIFSAVMIPPGAGVNVQLTTTLSPDANNIYLLPAGGVLQNAFEARVVTVPPSGAGLLPVPLPNVGIQAKFAEEISATVRCADEPVTSAAGIVTCDLVVGSELGSGQMEVIVGMLGTQIFTYPVTIIPGAPSSLSIIQGNGQSGGPGQVTPLALVVEVRDSANNTLRNVEIGWQILAGSGELVSPRFLTDNNGRASTQVRFGPQPGTVTVRASTGSLTTNFTLTNTAAGGILVSAESGSGQTAQLNQPFPAPLVVRVTSGSGAPLPGTVVTFTSTGPVTLGSTAATTNAQGFASVNVTAGGMAGAATVTATASGASAVFNLTVTPAGPRIDSLLNGASFLPGASPCAVGVIRGRFGIPANTVLTPGAGPIPTLAFTLSGISVHVGGQSAPLYYLSNIEGTEQIGFQIPCEQRPGPSELRVTAGGAAAILAMTLTDVAPGVFETQISPGTLQGIALRPNGTYITPSNPALHNEVVTGYFNGLGATLDAQGTNVPGIGQTLPLDRLIIGVNNRGMTLVSASYAPNLIGVWVVQFRITSEAGAGDRQAYAIGVRNFEGNVIYGQPSTIAVRAQ